MAPTVLLSPPGMDRRPPFSLERHLMALSSPASTTCSAATARHHHHHHHHSCHQGEKKGVAESSSCKRKNQIQYQTLLHCHKVRMGLVVEECAAVVSGAAGAEGGRAGSSNLAHITLRTLALLRRNQLLQLRLSLLQAETRAFVQSVLASNPPAHTHH